MSKQEIVLISFFHKTINRLHRSVSERQFLYFSSALVGIVSALAAIVLKSFVHWINGIVAQYSEQQVPFYLFVLFPMLGIFLSVLFVRRVLKGDFKKGTAEIVYTIAKKSSIISPNQIPGHIVTSGLTVGFGGSAGLESPMVSAGSAIGSTYAQSFRLSHKQRTILLACGAAAGIAAAFNSPIAGVLFAVEVLLVDISIAAFIPLIIAAATAALLSKIILKEGVLLAFSLQTPFDYTNVPYYLALGLLCGFVSLYYVRVFSSLESRLSGIQNIYLRVFAGGIVLALLLMMFPTLFGEGYESIKSLANLRPDEVIKKSIFAPLLHSDWNILIFIALIVLTKGFAVALTLGSGGNGGNFAPSLFVGAYLGSFFSRLVNALDLGPIPESNFILVSMAGILSGIFYAPLTAIFLIAEITGGYGLMIPLMIVAALSVTVARYFEPLSMEARKLSGKLKLSVEDRDKYLLSKLEFSEMIESNFETVAPEETLRDLVRTISKSHRNLFPVVNKTGQLLGIIKLDDVRDIIFNSELYDKVTLHTLMQKPSAVVSKEDDLHDVLKKFDTSGDWNLPVVEDGVYLGIISKSTILTRYRTELISTL